MSDPDDSNLLIHQEPPPSLLHIPDIDHDLHDSLEANHFALLRLNSNSSFSSNPDDHLHHHHHHKACSTCGCTRSFSKKPVKGHPPSLSPSFQDSLTTTIPSDHSEPTNPKKLILDQEYLTLLGFSKLSLPHSAPALNQPPSLPLFHPVVCRSASDPFNSPSRNAVVLPPMDSLAAESGFPVVNSNPHSPENARNGVIQVTPPSNSGLPPLPPTLRRSISDPTPSPAKTHSWSSSSGDATVGLSKEKTPNSKKRLRRMKDRMNEMSKWCEQVIREQQEEEDGGAEYNNASTKDDPLPDFEESVFVERVGEGLTVGFKCPCGKGYQILLSGRDCYYKLM